jgi:hypothetical protein
MDPQATEFTTSSIAIREDVAVLVEVGKQKRRAHALARTLAAPRCRKDVSARSAGRSVLANAGRAGVMPRSCACDNFPPVECEGEALSGMGTPDLLGTSGHSLTSPTIRRKAPRSSGRPDGLRASHQSSGGVESGRTFQFAPERPAVTSITLVAHVDPSQPVARFEVGGSQFILRQGEWSQ